MPDFATRDRLDGFEIRGPVLNCEYTWDLTYIFPTIESWHAEFESVQAAFPTLASFKGRVLESAATLRGFLELNEDLGVRAGKLGAYASLSYSRDAGDTQARALLSCVEQLINEQIKCCGFFDSEVLEADRSKAVSLMSDDPALQKYKFMFAQIERFRPYARGAEIEEVLGAVSALGGTPAAMRSALHDGELSFDAIVIDGDKVDVNHGSIEALLAHPMRAIRNAAYESYTDGYKKFMGTFGETLIGHARASSVFARVRRFSSTYDSALFREGLPREVFEAVLGTCREHRPIFHRYFEARARLLGLEKVAEFDLSAPLQSGSLFLPYESAVNLVLESVVPLGDGYVEAAKRGLTIERWAEVYPGPRKVSTPFSGGAYGTRPYMYLNYAPSMRGAGVLAHELGHSMHSHITQQHQPPCYFSCSSLVAETASNLNQVLLRDAVLNKADNCMALAMLDEAFYYTHRYLFLMPTLSEVEDALYSRLDSGRAMTPQEFSDTAVTAFSEAYGDKVSFEPERLCTKWAQFPHFYQKPYYLFQYAVGISAAMAIGKRLLTGDDGMRERYLQFLAAGGDRGVMDLFRMVNVDLRSPDLYSEAFGVLEGYVERLERIAALQPIRTTGTSDRPFVNS